MKCYAPLLMLFALLPIAIACGQEPEFSDVIGKDWNLVEVRQTPANTTFDRSTLEKDFDDVFTLQFDTERVSGKGAPNRFFAPYTLADNQAITISHIAGTLMLAFREPEGLKEYDFFTYLQNTYKWNLADKKLELYTTGEDGIEAVLFFVSPETE